MLVSFVTRIHTATQNIEGKFPVVLQITHNRKVWRIRLGLYAYDYQFENQDIGRFRKGTHNVQENNEEIEKALQKAHRIYEEYFEHRPFDYKRFASLYREKEEQRKSYKVAEFALEVSEDFARQGKGASANDYRNLSQRILKVYPNDIHFYEFNEEWLKSMEKYWIEKKTKGYNYMVRLKALYNKAIQARLVEPKHNPFKIQYINPFGYDFNHLKNLEFERDTPERILDLSKEQLIKLKNYKPISETEEKYFNTWWLGFYLFGVNMTDLAKLKWEHIKDGRWHYDRSKTKIKGIKNGKPVVPEALELLKKLDTGGKYILEVYNDPTLDAIKRSKRAHYYTGRIRKACKRIASRLDFPSHFTWYSVRHSAITLALNEGMDKNSISKLADHKHLSTLDHYAGNVDDKKVLETMRALTSF